MKDPIFLRLESLLSDRNINGTCVLCQCVYEGKWKWFCRLASRRKTVIKYGDSMDSVLSDSLEDFFGVEREAA